MQTVTAHQVINKRMQALMMESLANTQRITEIRREEQALLERQAEIEVETQILEAHGNRRDVTFVRTSQEPAIHAGRKAISDRMDFESTLSAIFSQFNRNLKIAELIEQLDVLGWKWSTSQSAYNYITRCGLIQKVSHGTYGILR